MSRLVARLSGRRVGVLADLSRLLAMRAGETPARPDLGLPVLPPWLPDQTMRRNLQEAIARSVRAGDPRLLDARVSLTDEAEAPVYGIHARLRDGAVLGAIARLERGRLGVTK